MDWITHFEKSDGLATPTYQESMEFIERLAATSRFAKVSTFGKTPQGRDMKCVVLGKIQTPREARRRNKAVVMIQNAIHGGEMEGKDAWMLLLREILITKELEHLLKHLVIVLVPVFNVDGHERRDQHNRPNQIGPMEQGWRTTAQNLDLNRDYIKADAPEMRSLLALYHYWLPDFYIDNHCTDGADFQYRVLYCLETHQHIHPTLAEWAEDSFVPAITQELESQGIPTAPYNEGNNLSDGLINHPANPRLSVGYSAIQNRFCLLVEAHSLKPYADRVYSTKAMNQAALDYLNRNSKELRKRNRLADEDTIQEYCHRKTPFPLVVSLKQEPEAFLFKGIASYKEESAITGNSVIRYTGEPLEFEIPLYRRGEVTETVIAPEGYSIPVEYAHIAEHLQMHGVRVKRIKSSCTVEAERYRFKNVSFASKPYESRIRAHFETEIYREKILLTESTIFVPVAQRALRVILHLLEPSGPDSLVRWGFFLSIFERKEYAEPYILEPIAQKMLQNDPRLKEEFQNRLELDENFRSHPEKRLDFFYQRSVYFDRKENVYPVARLLENPYA